MLVMIKLICLAVENISRYNDPQSKAVVVSLQKHMLRRVEKMRLLQYQKPLPFLLHSYICIMLYP